MLRRALFALALLLAPIGARAAITYVGAGTAVGGSGANATAAYPAGTQSGDGCLLVAVSRDAQAHTIGIPGTWGGSLWTQVAQGNQGGATGAEVSVWWRVLDTGGTGDLPTVTRSSTGAYVLTQIACWRGVSRTASPPYIAGALSSTTTTAGSTLAAATASVTTTVDNSLVLHILGTTGSTNAAIGYSSPSGTATGTTYSPGASAGGASTTRTALAVYSGFKTPAGAAGTANVTIDQASNDRAIQVALIPDTNGTALMVSKANGFGVLAPGAGVGVTVSKVVGYAVVSTESRVAVSKMVAYAVLVESPPPPANRPSIRIITDLATEERRDRLASR